MLDQFAGWMNDHGVRVGALLGSVLVVVLGAVVIALTRRLLFRLLAKNHARIGLSYGTSVMLTRTVTAVLWILVALVVLEVWGIRASGLWTSFISIATLIGVGFLATWTMVSNVTATFFLTIWRPFDLGDEVEVLPENLKGRVIDRTMMFTVLREEEGTTIQVPNNLFFQRLFRVKENAEQLVFPFPDQGGFPFPGRSERARAAAQRRSTG
jgi:small-conductance mechanosensitive channel